MWDNFPHMRSPVNPPGSAHQPPDTASRASITLRAVLRCVEPLVRLLVRQGVTYPAFAAALKRLFVEAAHAEIESQGMKRTDSAVTLLSGVHRKDVRELAIGGRPAREVPASVAPLGIVGQVVARWLSGRGWTTAQRKPKPLPRSGGRWNFDALVAEVSTDVRPRAMLDEMLRLGVVQETDAGVVLSDMGLAPHAGFDAMSEAMALNLRDHAASAVGNLADSRNRLEQAIYVDEITAESVTLIQGVAREAWQEAFTKVMATAQARFDHDAMHASADQRQHRARLGIYFHDEAMAQPPAPSPGAKAPDTRSPVSARRPTSRTKP